MPEMCRTVAVDDNVADPRCPRPSTRCATRGRRRHAARSSRTGRRCSCRSRRRSSGRRSASRCSPGVKNFSPISQTLPPGTDAVARHGVRRRLLDLPRERMALRPDAGVDDADDDALAGVGPSADLRPEAVPAGESEERRREVGVGLAKSILLDRQYARRLGERLCLLAGQVGREAVVGDGVVVVGLRADLLQEAVCLSFR